MAKKKTTEAVGAPTDMLRQPAELRFADELTRLAENDDAQRPAGWNLSPRAVRTFIVGSDGSNQAGKARSRSKNSSPPEISRKFHGDDTMVDRAIVSLMSNRGLILVGEPGTAKSMLSELLAAAVSGTSALTIQGTAGTTEDQIKYSWNYALLIAEGPTPRALVPAPLYQGLLHGRIVRFEEVTRCLPEIQDTLVSVLSEKLLHVPELEGGDAVVYAKPGFNVIATANTRDRGVHEMSAALKRRFNFETVLPIADKGFELQLVLEQSQILLSEAGVDPQLDRDVLDVLVTTFHDLRDGRTEQGAVVERPSTVMSTAEAVSVAFAAGLDAWHFGDQRVTGEHLARQLVGAVLKDSEDDAKKVRTYFDIVAKTRAKQSAHWKSFYDSRGVLGK